MTHSLFLVSGSRGFVGQNVLPHFEDKYVFKTLGRTGADYSWEDLDEMDTNFSAYLHLAGKAHDVANTSEASDYFKVNTDLTKKLFQHFLRSEAKLFIYMSSVKAAADVVEGVLTENVKASPKTPYGRSKLKAEEFLMGQELPVNKKVVILRPSMIHGPGNKGNLNLLYQFVQRGIPYPLAAFENRRSFLSIDNLLFILERILSDENFPGGIYNAADDEMLSTNELVELIAKASGKKAKLWKVPKPLMQVIAKVGGLLHLPLNKHRLQKLTESYIVSNEKIKKALGIERLPISAGEGLSRTIKSFTS